MKKRILTLAVLASMSSMAAVAAEEAEIDMSDPTDVYTTIGLSYGNQGLDFTSMLLLSSTETQKSGMIFDAKDILNEDAEYDALLGREPSSTKYRLRWGTINTTNGLGFSVDAMNFDHPFFGRSTVVQTGPLMTIPIGDDFLMWPLVYVGGVFMEDNTLDVLDSVPGMIAKAEQSLADGAKKLADKQAQIDKITDAQAKAAAQAALNAEVAKIQASEEYKTAKKMVDNKNSILLANEAQTMAATVSSDGMSWASTVLTGMVYARYAITDKLWALGSYRYTTDIQGKSWDDEISEGGLQMANQGYDIKLGYQITDRQNITVYWESDDSDATDDKWNIGYNYAF